MDYSLTIVYRRYYTSRIECSATMRSINSHSLICNWLNSSAVWN